MLIQKMSFIMIVFMFSLALLPLRSRALTLPKLQYEKYQLANGLNVILHQDHSIPVVSANIWYHVGSKNEKRGRTGFAHLFEHMMFQGSQHHDSEYFEPLEKIGGEINGSTTEDRTNYFENIPANYLELALWLESDRMGFLLPAMTQEKLDNQRDVVKNERRQRMDNQPYAKAFELLTTLLYPEDHPYSWPVIGSMEDLSAASIQDVSEFFKTYYTPSNSSLCIAGDFDPAMAKQLVEKYFGSIPPGPSVNRLSSWVPELNGVKRMVAQDNVKLPRLYYAWHTPGYYKPGDAEFDLLATVLTSGKTSRLYKALVYDQQIAQDVAAYQASKEISSTFNVVVTAKEGHSLAEIEKAVDAELQKVLANGITAAELAQAQTDWEARFVRQLEVIGNKSDKLNEYNVFLGDPDKFQWDMDRYANATVADVQKYVRQYLDLNRRVILHIVPQGELKAATAELDRAKEPEPMTEPAYVPPKIQRAKLSNGLDLLLVEDHKLPLVQANLVIKSGFSADPTDRPGTASLTADLLDEGTKSRTALQISDEAQRLGANLGTGSSFDGATVNLNVLKGNLDPGLNLMADIVLNPTFPNQELERRRQNYLGRIQQESKQPLTSAIKTYIRLTYGANHPYGQPYTGSGTEYSLKAITRDDLVNYYKANYFPNNAAIVIAGDITLAEAKQKFEKVFGQWKPGSVSPIQVPVPVPLTTTKIYILDKPGAAQSVVVLGNLGISRNDPEFDACDVVNNALGGQFGSRINLNLREDKGYTYGARSSFLPFRSPGIFYAYAQVQTEVTKQTLVELKKELTEITASRPLNDKELTDSKNNLIKSFPQQFERLAGIAGELTGMVMYNLPEDEWSGYLGRINAVDGQTAAKVAKDHVHPDALLVVIVGDKEKIEPGIRELNLGEIHYVDAEANVIQ